MPDTSITFSTKDTPDFIRVMFVVHIIGMFVIKVYFASADGAHSILGLYHLKQIVKAYAKSALECAVFDG